MPYLLRIAAGAMMYVVVEELVPDGDRVRIFTFPQKLMLAR